MKKGIVIALLSMLMLQGNALAAQLDAPEYSRDTRLVTLGGKVGGAYTLVSVEVLKPDGDWAEITDETLSFDRLAYFNQTTSDENGEFSLQFGITGETGIYPLRIYSASDDEFCYDNTLRIVSAADIERLLTQAVNAASADELQFIFEGENADILGIDISQVQGDRSAFLEKLYAEKTALEWDSVADIEIAIIKTNIIGLVNSASAAAEIAALLEQYESYFTLDNACSYNLYSNNSYFDDERRDAVLDNLTNEDYKTIDEFRKTFGDKTLLYACYDQDNYHNIGDILAESEVIKAYDTGRYTKLSSKLTVHKELNARKSPYETVEQLAEEIKRLSDKNVTSGSGGSGGGGGGGSYAGGSGNDVVSLVLPAETTPSAAPKTFFDMVGFEWAEEAVNALGTAGIVSGRSEQEFCPGEPVTREEFLQMLVGAMNAQSMSDIHFVDVTADKWYYNAVRTGVALKLTSGISENTFGVGMPITRQDMAVMVYRALGSMGMEFSSAASDFVDKADISDYAYEAVGALQSAGMISGTGGGRFEPQATVNRASAAKLIYEVYRWRESNA